MTVKMPKTTFPADVQVKHFVLVAKHAVDFFCEEDLSAEDHLKWFHAQWWENYTHLSYHKTLAKAERVADELTRGPYPVCWIIYDHTGGMRDGNY